MLARPSFCDDSGFAHSQSQQSLAERIIDLMSAGVVQIFSLEPNLGASDIA
jgi:hypothetical protein